MPTPAEILAGLSEIANRARGIAVAWHVVIAVALLAMASGWRPSERLARTLVALPLASVASLAFVFGNPFNGVVFAAGSTALVALAQRGNRRVARRGASGAFWLGVASLAFGWVYPHFLDAAPVMYLVMAPLGLVPCPTLAASMGLAAMGGGLGAKTWSYVLAGFGLFYGAFGVVRLGVWLDAGLVFFACALFVVARRPAGDG